LLCRDGTFLQGIRNKELNYLGQLIRKRSSKTKNMFQKHKGGRRKESNTMRMIIEI
jgi:hypothetical protein